MPWEMTERQKRMARLRELVGQHNESTSEEERETIKAEAALICSGDAWLEAIWEQLTWQGEVVYIEPVVKEPPSGT